MSTAYIDCYAGITPQRFFAAIVDLGIDVEILTREMERLGIPFRMGVHRRIRMGARGTDIDFTACLPYKGYTLLKEILNLIRLSSLRPSIKEKIVLVFKKIAKAESKVHGQPVYSVKLHEVGSPISVLLIGGIVIGMDFFHINEMYASGTSLGKGKVRCSHGVLTVPTPATSELIKGIPVSHSRMSGELTTPSGAAILSVFARGFTDFPSLYVKKIGRGFGPKAGTVLLQPLTIYLGQKI